LWLRQLDNLHKICPAAATLQPDVIRRCLMANRQSSRREAKRELVLSGGNDQRGAKAAFRTNTGRASAADRPLRSKTKAANRRKIGGGR
jgi:hypothetical protein